MTLILSSLVLVSVGLSGTTGMTAALVIGGVVCTALSMAGGFITDLKIGYWLGTTPRKQEAWKFLGTFVAAATVAGVMIILNKSYGFVGEGALVAPQANAMAAVIQPLMTGGQTPWMLYFCGAALALVLTSIGVPALAFALGMFIPMELNLSLIHIFPRPPGLRGTAIADYDRIWSTGRQESRPSRIRRRNWGFRSCLPNRSCNKYHYVLSRNSLRSPAATRSPIPGKHGYIFAWSRV